MAEIEVKDVEMTDAPPAVSTEASSATEQEQLATPTPEGGIEVVPAAPLKKHTLESKMS